jgi:hypothetical protein
MYASRKSESSYTPNAELLYNHPRVCLDEEHPRKPSVYFPLGHLVKHSTGDHKPR